MKTQVSLSKTHWSQTKIHWSQKLSSWVMLYSLLVVSAFLLVSCATTGKTNVVTHTMTLSDHEFAPVDFVPQAGDKILISNRSDISHSIYITYPDGSMVNLGVQTPGKTFTWVVPKEAKGEFLLQCWIHPIIRATLVVNGGSASASVSSSLLVSKSSTVSPGLTNQEIFNGRQNICSSRNRRA